MDIFGSSASKLCSQSFRSVTIQIPRDRFRHQIFSQNLIQNQNEQPNSQQNTIMAPQLNNENKVDNEDELNASTSKEESIKQAVADLDEKDSKDEKPEASEEGKPKADLEELAKEDIAKEKAAKGMGTDEKEDEEKKEEASDSEGKDNAEKSKKKDEEDKPQLTEEEQKLQDLLDEAEKCKNTTGPPISAADMVEQSKKNCADMEQVDLDANLDHEPYDISDIKFDEKEIRGQIDQYADETLKKLGLHPDAPKDAKLVIPEVTPIAERAGDMTPPSLAAAAEKSDDKSSVSASAGIDAIEVLTSKVVDMVTK